MLSQVDKTCADVFGVLPRFLKNLLESEIWSVVLRPGRKPHWISFSLDSIISSVFKTLDNVNVIYLKIPKKHRWPHKRPSWATYAARGPCV